MFLQTLPCLESSLCTEANSQAQSPWMSCLPSSAHKVFRYIMCKFVNFPEKYSDVLKWHLSWLFFSSSAASKKNSNILVNLVTNYLNFRSKGFFLPAFSLGWYLNSKAYRTVMDCRGEGVGSMNSSVILFQRVIDSIKWDEGCEPLTSLLWCLRDAAKWETSLS